MYSLKIQTFFSAAHNLINYKGKCEKLHGHNWKVEVEISSYNLDEAGMVMDFKELKRLTNSVVQELDHEYLNELPYFKNISPSSENIAKYIYIKLKDKIPKNIKINKITVWESNNACASYQEHI